MLLIMLIIGIKVSPEDEKPPEDPLGHSRPFHRWKPRPPTCRRPLLVLCCTECRLAILRAVNLVVQWSVCTSAPPNPFQKSLVIKWTPVKSPWMMSCLCFSLFSAAAFCKSHSVNRGHRKVLYRKKGEGVNKQVPKWLSVLVVKWRCSGSTLHFETATISKVRYPFLNTFADRSVLVEGFFIVFFNQPICFGPNSHCMKSF